MAVLEPPGGIFSCLLLILPRYYGLSGVWLAFSFSRMLNASPGFVIPDQCVAGPAGTQQIDHLDAAQAGLSMAAT